MDYRTIGNLRSVPTLLVIRCKTREKGGEAGIFWLDTFYLNLEVSAWPLLSGGIFRGSTWLLAASSDSNLGEVYITSLDSSRCVGYSGKGFKAILSCN